MRWFVTRTRALPLKLLLLAWLIYAVVVAGIAAFVQIAAAAAVTIAVLGVLATVAVFPLLCALIVGAVALYAAPVVLVPRLWRQQRGRAVSIAFTIGLVVGTPFAATLLSFTAGRGISWIADRNPCAALRAGVTGSKPPSKEDCRTRR